MAKRLKILLMIFALGSFILPGQISFAQSSEMSCCKSSDQSNDCCKKTQKEEKPCHDSSQQNSCGDQCTACASCHFAAAFFYPVSHETLISYSKIQVQKETFTYVTPEISDIFSKIWQPPKIG